MLLVLLDDDSVLKHLQESSSLNVEHETFNEILALLIQGVIDAIKKQMDDYLGGELRRAPNAKIGFIDRKVNAM